MGVPVPAMPAPLSWQVLSWPVDADSEEGAVTNKKAGQGLKKDGGKVGCQEGTMSKNLLSYNNSDGARRDLLLCQFWVSGSISPSQTSRQIPPCCGRRAAAVLHTPQAGYRSGRVAGPRLPAA